MEFYLAIIYLRHPTMEGERVLCSVEEILEIPEVSINDFKITLKKEIEKVKAKALKKAEKEEKYINYDNITAVLHQLVKL